MDELVTSNNTVQIIENEIDYESAITEHEIASEQLKLVEDRNRIGGEVINATPEVIVARERYFNAKIKHNDAKNIKAVIDLFSNPYKPINTEQSGGTNSKLEKTYLKSLYKCKDGRTRKAFRIKGRGNTIFVFYKKQLTKISDIKPSKPSKPLTK